MRKYAVEVCVWLYTTDHSMDNSSCKQVRHAKVLMYQYSRYYLGTVQAPTAPLRFVADRRITKPKYSHDVEHLSHSIRKNNNLHMLKQRRRSASQFLADQLRSDQRFCFRYTDSTIPFLLKSKIFNCLAFFCDCTGRFVSHLFGSHIGGFPTRRLICLGGNW